MKIIISFGIFLIAFIVALIYFFYQKGINFIEFKDAIKNYKLLFSTKLEEKPRVITKHFFFYTSFPSLLALGTNVSSTVNNNIISIISVIIPILIAIILIFVQKIDNKTAIIIDKNSDASYLKHKNTKRFRDETIGLIMIEIYASVFLLILCFTITFLQITPEQTIKLPTLFVKISETLKWLISFIIYYLFFFFVLNLLIITKRFYKTIQ